MLSRTRAIFRVLSEFYGIIVDRNIGLISAGVAFFALLALFPGIAALISLLALFADPLTLQQQLSVLRDLIPPATYTLLENQIARLVWANDGTLGWAGIFSTLTALFLARLGVDAMLRGLNAIYGNRRRRGAKHVFAVVVITLGMVMAGVIALLALLVVPVTLALFPIPGISVILVELSRWGITLGMMSLWLCVFYWIGPLRVNGGKIKILPGLLLALSLWVAASLAFTYYLVNFGRYNEVYGSLGAVVALLMWFYLSAYVVMIGGVLNAILEHRAMTVRAASDENDQQAKA